MCNSKVGNRKELIIIETWTDKLEESNDKVVSNEYGESALNGNCTHLIEVCDDFS